MIHDTLKLCIIAVTAVSMEHCFVWLFLADAYLIFTDFCRKWWATKNGSFDQCP